MSSISIIHASKVTSYNCEHPELILEQIPDLDNSSSINVSSDLSAVSLIRLSTKCHFQRIAQCQSRGCLFNKSEVISCLVWACGGSSHQTGFNEF